MMNDAKKQANQPDTTNSVSQVVKRMHQEYSKTGVYNASDLHRVFGNPKDSVGFASSLFSPASNQKRK